MATTSKKLVLSGGGAYAMITGGFRPGSLVTISGRPSLTGRVNLVNWFSSGDMELTMIIEDQPPQPEGERLERVAETVFPQRKE